MTQPQIIQLIGATAGIIAFTWFASIKQFRYHGIYRFFSFESIAAMLILNISFWGKNQFSPMHIVSWIFLFASVPIAIIGFKLLINSGKPRGVVEFEDTSKLVTTGIYKFIRHPLYCSLLLLGFGIFFKNVDVITVILVIINTAALYLTARAEEGEMIKKFGDEYREYMKKSKMFIPFLF